MKVSAVTLLPGSGCWCKDAIYRKIKVVIKRVSERTSGA